jgi:membrane protease YdiL (CAAX protease family)
VKRLIVFIRSIIPEDSAQLLLLCGSILLLICIQLRCFPMVPGWAPGAITLNLNTLSDTSLSAYKAWLQFSYYARLLLLFAGAAGLYICFFPGKYPARRILVFVCLPAGAGLANLVGRFLYLAGHAKFSNLGVAEKGAHFEIWVLKTIWSLGPAIHIGLLGLVMVFAFLVRLDWGISSLPLSVARASDLSPEQNAAWHQIALLIWFGVAVIGVAPVPLRFACDYLIEPLAKSGDFGWLYGQIYTIFSFFLWLVLLPAMAIWAADSSRWKELREFMRLRNSKFVLLACILPTVVQLTPNLAAYVTDRIRWATFNFGQLPPPEFGSYFREPNLYLFLLLVSAVAEEIVWRGYLQPRFIQQFGLVRGIVLLGLVWGAFHFESDFRAMGTDYQVLANFVLRLSNCISLAFVLGWLTLRARSIWPAVLAHGFSNIWLFALTEPRHGQNSYVGRVIVVVCWVLFAFVFFHYWPPEISEPEAPLAVEIPPEPAV